MKYVLLLRGINVGIGRRVPMAELRRLFTEMGFSDVITYINSGNVIFSSEEKPDPVKVQTHLEAYFGFNLDLLILGAESVRRIAETIPETWLNDKEQKSDVLYLFGDVDEPDLVKQIGYRPEFETILYTQGALITNVTRKNQPKSSILKIMGTPLYQRMTVRNVTTARKLAELVGHEL